MRVVFDTRFYRADMYMAVEDHWRAEGRDVDCLYIAHQREAYRMTSRAGRDSRFVTAELKELEVSDPDAALAGIEQRYGDRLLPLMRYGMSERYFRDWTRERQLDALARQAIWFERLFQDFRPDLYVGEAPDMMQNWLAYGFAPAFGCRAVGLNASTVPAGRLLMMSDHDTVPGAIEAYEEIRRRGVTDAEEQAARAMQATFMGEGTKLDYVGGRTWPDFVKRFLKGAVVREHLGGSWMQLRERMAGNYFLQDDPTIARLRQPLRALRAWASERLFVKDPVPDRPFVFYPLHYEPEAATLMHGSYFENQIEVVLNLARSLPAGWRLVVKEHPAMRNLRKLGFYRRLLKVPNVALVPMAVPTRDLILDAQVVAVISGSPGLEASLVGKPVVMFGDFPWDYSPVVHKVGAMKDLPALIRRAAESGLGRDHPDVLAFCASWDAALPVGRYYKTRQYDWLEPGNVKLVADALRRAAEGEGERPVEVSRRQAGQSA